MKPFWLGVTGGIGAGKSTVTAILSSLGAGVVDSDVEAHALGNEDTEYRHELTERFGVGLFLPDGSLNRAELATRLFGDPVAVSDFNSIISPRLVARTRSKLTKFAETHPVVVLDGALIFEYGRHTDFEEVWLVTAAPAIADQRLLDKGMTAEQIARRRSAQWDDAVKRTMASRIIENNGTVAELTAKVEEMYRSINH